MNDEEALVYIKRLIHMGYLCISEKQLEEYLFEETVVGTDKFRPLLKFIKS